MPEEATFIPGVGWPEACVPLERVDAWNWERNIVRRDAWLAKQPHRPEPIVPRNTRQRHEDHAKGQT